MKILRNIVLVILALILLLVAAVAVALIVIDPNDYKPHIERAAAEHTNLELNLHGDIGWSLFPLGLEVNDVEARLEDDDFVRLDQLLASVDLWSLIRMSPSVHTFSVSGFSANLVVDEDGQGNWERIMPERPEEEPVAEDDPVDTEVTLTDEDGEAQPLSFNVQEVRITDAQVRFRDLQNDQDVSLTNARLLASNIALGQEFPLEIGFEVALTDPQLDVVGDLAMRINASENLQVFAVRDLDSRFDMSGEPFDGRSVTATLKGALSADLENETATVSNLEAGFENIRATTSLDVANFTESPRISGRFDLHEFSPRELMRRMGLEDIETEDPDVLKKVVIGSDIATENDTLSLRDLMITLDDTRFEGMFGFGLESGAIDVDLQGNSLNLDRYLPPAREEEDEEEDEEVAEADRDAELLPLETLRELVFDARIGLTELIASNLTISDIEVKANGRDGQLSLEHLRGNMYEGDFNIAASLDARTDNPQWSLNKRLNAVRSQPLLVDLAEIDLLSGKVNVRADLATRGNSINALIEGSNGDARFDIEEGAFEGFNLTHMACRGIAMVHREELAANDWGERTPFNDLYGEMTLDSGVLNNTDLTADLAGIRLEGDGTVNAMTLEMAYRLGLRIVGDVHRDRACRVNERVQNIVIPVACQGNLTDDPAGLCRFDTRRFSEVLTSMGRAELDRQREQVEQRAQEEIDRQRERAREEVDERVEEEKDRARDRIEEEGRRMLDRFR